MTITFENDNDVIVYALEKVIAYARTTQQVFVAQCVWWLASIIGLELELVNHIDNPQAKAKVTIATEEIPVSGKLSTDEAIKEGQNIQHVKATSAAPRDIQED
jgi:hypothetical protein